MATRDRISIVLPHRLWEERTLGTVDADRIRERIERLEAVLLEGKIEEQTYRELKEKYEAELAEISAAQASGGSGDSRGP